MKIDFNTKKCKLGRCHPGSIVVYDNNLWSVVNRSNGEYFLREIISDGDQRVLMLDSDLTIDLILRCTRIGSRGAKRGA